MFQMLNVSQIINFPELLTFFQIEEGKEVIYLY